MSSRTLINAEIPNLGVNTSLILRQVRRQLEMMQEAILIRIILPKTEAHTSTIRKVIIMTTSIDIVFEERLDRPNHILNFSQYEIKNEFDFRCISGVSLQSSKSQKDCSLTDVNRRVSSLFKQWLTESDYLQESQLWLFSTHDCWQPDSRVTMHKKLWKTIFARYPVLAEKIHAITNEASIKNDEGKIKFFGLANFETSSFDFVTEFIRTYSTAFIILGNMDATDESASFLYKNAFWQCESEVNWANLSSALCCSGATVIRSAGAFDDDEASIDIFTSKDMLRNFSSLREMKLRS